ncbi:MAG TPA: glycosyltransferase, partial [Hyphomicrobiaceae bacterium]|nr:glycosyltransferase [Hyphomicrobiaceae bacterium]
FTFYNLLWWIGGGEVWPFNAVKKLYNSVMVRSDIVIANSDWTANLIRARYGTPDEKLVVIPRGIDPAVFDREAVAPERTDQLRKLWGVPDGTALVFVPARLAPRKGQAVVIDAVAELVRSGVVKRPFVVIFAGSAQGRADYEAELDAHIASAGLTGVARRVGHLDDVAAGYAIADVTVVPSIEPEAFGRTSAEAQSSGCPVITSDIGATPETILAAGRVPPGTETGWVFRNRDAADLARTLAAALSVEGPERAALGARARAHAASRFTLFNLQRDTLAVYDRLLGTTLSPTFARYRANETRISRPSP